MTEEIGVCEVCGKKFTKKNSRQKYCSETCMRYANRHHETEHKEEPGAKVIRTFYCRRCGTEVLVTDPQDKRLKFCSQHCEKLYWKHPEKAKVTVVERKFRCKGCGKLVEITNAYDRRHTFCSKVCQNRYNARLALHKGEDLSGLRSFRCVECGKLVEIKETGDRRRKFCSSKCRLLHYAKTAGQKRTEQRSEEK